jgi:hypothetical protein
MDSKEFRGLGKENERAKKMVEEMELEYFLAAYEEATDDPLSLLTSSERPDFICTRPDDTRVGLELVKVVRDPQSKWIDQVFFNSEFMRPVDALLGVFEAVQTKESKRQSPGWKLKENTILVVQVMDCPLDQFAGQFERGSFVEHGFEEIWLADYSELEAYSNIEVFGLYPDHIWGHYSQERGKPYG